MIRPLHMLVCATFAISGPVMAQDINGENLSEQEAGADAALNQNNVMTVRNITRTEIVRGLWVYDASGQPVGQVDHLAGNDVVVGSRSKRYVVLFTDMFAYNQYGKDYFATRKHKAELEMNPPKSGR